MTRSPGLHSLNTFIRRRWLIQELVSRDLKLRYRGSALGFTWTLLNPLLFMAIYSLVFSVYLRINIAHYPLFLLSGLIPWNWSAGSIQQGTSAVIEGRMYVGKTTFPAEVLMIVPVLSHFVNFLMALPLLVILAIIFHVQVGVPFLALPLVLIIQMVLTLGLLYFAGTLNVFYRGFQQLVVYILLFMFYLSPIFYSINAVPAEIRPWMFLNPFVTLAVSYQDIFYYNVMPNMSSLAYLAAFSLLTFVAGRALFNHYQDSFGEYL